MSTRILVVSDTHGKCERAVEVYRRLSSDAPVDAVIHCGDFYGDAMEIQKATGAVICAVRGNCDGSFEENGFTIFETEAGGFLVTHGHMEDVGPGLQRLYYKVLENGCVGACFGHTHRAVNIDIDGIHLLNPGSLTRPRDGQGGSFGLIVISGGDVRCGIYRYDAFMSGGTGGGHGGEQKGAKPRVRGGYLRKLMNYSDSL